MIKLKNKLTYSYILVTILSVVLISFLANIFLKQYFNKYVIENIDERKMSIVNSVENQYEDNKWNTAAIEDIGINAMENGLIIKVVDTKGDLVWDARQYNNGMCEMMIHKISSNMNNRYPNFNGSYVTNNYDLISGEGKKGTIEIGYYGPFYYSDKDVSFLTTLNKIFIVVGLIGVLLCVLLGAIISGAISKPILRVIEATNLISIGRYKDRVTEKSNIQEISNLVMSVNNLAQSLEEQEQLRKRLTRDVAHELRTPLTTLQSHLEAILDGIWEPTIERLKSFHEEILRLHRLVGDLENLSKYDQDAIKLNIEEINVKDLINQLVINFEKQFIDKNIILKTNVDECIINADKDKISQALINLISNALKYTPEGREVNIYCQKHGMTVIVTVRDNGIGISKEHLHYIFERFYRVDESRTRNTGGAGIGLTITKAIIEAHKGKITVESEINKGTQFIISLPATS